MEVDFLYTYGVIYKQGFERRTMARRRAGSKCRYIKYCNESIIMIMEDKKKTIFNSIPFKAECVGILKLDSTK